MRKDQNFTGQPVFTQLLKLIDRREVFALARQYRSDRYYKCFMTYDHLVMMLYAVFQKCTSLREVTTGLQVCQYRVHHLGLRRSPRRSTISDANRKRTPEVFASIYKSLYRRYRKRLPDSRYTKKWYSRLYLIDSTTISLFKEILKNAGPPVVNGRRKGGIKVHTLVRAEEDVPCRVSMTAAASHDAPFIHGLRLSKGSIAVFDRGYYSYKQYRTWGEEGVFWVTRRRSSATWKLLKENDISEHHIKHGVVRDCLVLLGNPQMGKHKQFTARLILFRDAQTNKEFEFLTNLHTYSPLTIAELYKRRWQIELLYKRLKQNFPLQYFLGDNENAIRIQIWCALIADLMLKIVMGMLKRKWSFANLSSMIRIHLMSYVRLIRFLNNPDAMLINEGPLHNKGPTLFD